MRIFFSLVSFFLFVYLKVSHGFMLQSTETKSHLENNLKQEFWLEQLLYQFNFFTVWGYTSMALCHIYKGKQLW